MGSEDVERMPDAPICMDCVGEPYLHQQIANGGIERECYYCGSVGPTILLEEMADRVESAFQEHYERTPENPSSLEYAMLKDEESSYDWERAGEPTSRAIMNAAIVADDIADDVQELLDDRYGSYDHDMYGEETEFASAAYYAEKAADSAAWESNWYALKRSIRTEARFFSRDAAAKLKALFDGIDRMGTRRGARPIVDAGPGTVITHLYRARVFQSDEKLMEALKRPDLELSAPPSSLAASGRMNAKGISTFYGSTTEAIALAEVRPPVGSQVAQARFEITRSLRLLDLNALKGAHVGGSIFDPSFGRELGRMKFLKTLCERMARPVMPDDQDAEYLPTQAVADYLATEGEYLLDGIVYPSVQSSEPGVNVVLFHKASRCASLALPKLLDVQVDTWRNYEDGPEREYTVNQWVSSKASPEDDPDPLSRVPLVPSDADIVRQGDHREETLRIDLPSMRIHVVKAVKVDTEVHRVARFEWDRDRDLSF